MSGSCGGRLDGGGDALIAAATADVAAHRIINFTLGRVFVHRQERGCLHDLAGLAIAALRDIQSAPGFLYRMVSVVIEALDRCHGAPVDIAHGDRTGTGGFTIHMDCAGAAQRHATAVFRASEPQLVPKIPEQWHRWVTIERLPLAVDL